MINNAPKMGTTTTKIAIATCFGKLIKQVDKKKKNFLISTKKFLHKNVNKITEIKSPKLRESEWQLLGNYICL